jgi:hypothetical protein
LAYQVALNLRRHGKSHRHNLRLDRAIKLPVPLDGLKVNPFL